MWDYLFHNMLCLKQKKSYAFGFCRTFLTDKDILGNPRELHHRCLEITPRELEDEVVIKGDEIKTYQQIVSFCKRRTTHLKYKVFSKAAERLPGARHMNAL